MNKPIKDFVVQTINKKDNKEPNILSLTDLVEKELKNLYPNFQTICDLTCPDGHIYITAIADRMVFPTNIDEILDYSETYGRDLVKSYGGYPKNSYLDNMFDDDLRMIYGWLKSSELYMLICNSLEYSDDEYSKTYKYSDIESFYSHVKKDKDINLSEYSDVVFIFGETDMDYYLLGYFPTHRQIIYRLDKNRFNYFLECKKLIKPDNIGMICLKELMDFPVHDCKIFRFDKNKNIIF